MRHRGRGRINREEGKQRGVEVQRGRETEEKMREREEKQKGE
jgi:hypothetical protein